MEKQPNIETSSENNKEEVINRVNKIIGGAIVLSSFAYITGKVKDKFEEMRRIRETMVQNVQEPTPEEISEFWSSLADDSLEKVFFQLEM
jgi:hypothetical protein